MFTIKFHRLDYSKNFNFQECNDGKMQKILKIEILGRRSGMCTINRLEANWIDVRNMELTPFFLFKYSKVKSRFYFIYC